MYPDEVRIAISLSTHTVPLTLETRYGLASQYLNEFFEKGFEGKTNQIFIKDSSFKMPPT